jgi:large subunit ribosomal protein L7/L12
MADLTQLAEQLVNLTVKEVKELTDILKDQYGIEPAAAGAVMIAGGAGAGAGHLRGAEAGSFPVVTRVGHCAY